MENLQQLQDAIASERQEFQDFKASVTQQLADKDATIASLQQQLTDAQNNPQLPDGTIASVGTIVEP